MSYRPEITVNLWSGLRSAAGGAETVTVRAATIGQMLDALADEYPGMEDPIEAGVSVSIDGKIYGQDLTQPIEEGQEVYILQRIRGG